MFTNDLHTILASLSLYSLLSSIVRLLIALIIFTLFSIYIYIYIYIYIWHWAINVLLSMNGKINSYGIKQINMPVSTSRSWHMILTPKWNQCFCHESGHRKRSRQKSATIGYSFALRVFLASSGTAQSARFEQI